MSSAAIEPTAEQLRRLAESPDTGPILMLNLLRFKDRADGLDGTPAITGREAYARYGEAVVPHLRRAGGSVVQLADGGATVIGPGSEEWDMVLLVSYPSRRAFLAMIADPGYQAIHGHRAAALRDSRLVCFSEPSG